jgi:hypothetical protein
MQTLLGSFPWSGLTGSGNVTSVAHRWWRGRGTAALRRIRGRGLRLGRGAARVSCGCCRLSRRFNNGLRRATCLGRRRGAWCAGDCALGLARVYCGRIGDNPWPQEEIRPEAKSDDDDAGDRARHLRPSDLDARPTIGATPTGPGHSNSGDNKGDADCDSNCVPHGQPSVRVVEFALQRPRQLRSSAGAMTGDSPAGRHLKSAARQCRSASALGVNLVDSRRHNYPAGEWWFRCLVPLEPRERTPFSTPRTVARHDDERKRPACLASTVAT